MRKLLRAIAAALVLSLVLGPVVLERCLARCSDGPSRTAAPAHCHAMRASSGTVGPAATCGHDHRPWSATGAVQAGIDLAVQSVALTTFAPLRAAVSFVTTPVRESPPGRPLPPDFVRPQRV